MTKTFEKYAGPAKSEPPKSRNPSYLGHNLDGGLMSLPDRLGASYVKASDYDVIAHEVDGCRARIRELEAENARLKTERCQFCECSNCFLSREQPAEEKT